METLELYAEVLYDGKGAKKNAVVEVEGSRIVQVYEGSPRGERFNAITPAFIDAHSHIGLERHGESHEESDVNDRGDSIWTYADALDGIQMEDRAFQLALAGGVAYSCVLPGSGNILGGKAAVVRHWAENTEEAFVRYAGYKGALGYNPKTTEEWKGHRPTSRQGILRELRVRLLKAQLNKKALEKGKKEREELEPEELFFLDLLEGKEWLRVHVHRQDDIFALLRLVDAFSLRVSVEHAGNVRGEKAFLALKERGIPVVYGPLDSFAYKNELALEWPTNIRALLKSGVHFGLMSDHPVIMAHTLFHSARWFLRYGWRKEQVVGLLTRKNVHILGLKGLGEVREGFTASLLLWKEGPFRLGSFPQPLVEGRWWEVPF